MPMDETGAPVAEEGLTPQPLAHKLDHVAQAIGYLLAQFQGKPRIEALLSAYIDEVQALEDALWTLLVDRTLDVAVGPQLTGIGAIVGQSQGSLSTANFRAFIRARILINLSDGTPEELITIARTVEPTLQIEIVEVPPAAVVVHFPAPTTLAPSVFNELLQAAKPAGVELQLQYHPGTVLASAFTLSSTSALQFSPALGFGSSAGGTGGHLDSVIE
jgi:hypothetical protein